MHWDTLADYSIYLTGFMASGKSSVGPIVATKLRLPFVDLDIVIEWRADRSIQEIFDTEGEAGFRELESAALESAKVPGVYALGGGALIGADNLALALRRGIVVYLEASPEELVRRLLDSETVRPLLVDKTGQRLSAAQLTMRVSSLLAARQAQYQRAHLSVRTDGRSVTETAENVLSALRRHLASRNERR